MMLEINLKVGGSNCKTVISDGDPLKLYKPKKIIFEFCQMMNESMYSSEEISEALGEVKAAIDRRIEEITHGKEEPMKAACEMRGCNQVGNYSNQFGGWFCPKCFETLAMKVKM